MNTPTTTHPLNEAFSRVELLAVSAALFLIALVVAPAFASNKTDAERLVCFNNLRQIGRAVQMWAGDHNQNPPWRTLDTEGGLKPVSGTRPGNAWFDYAFMSNQLVTPRILACPSDVGTLKVMTFGDFTSRSNRGNALSYVIGMESVGDAPRSLVSGDRNLNVGPAAGCSANINNVNSITTFNGVSSTRWTNSIHGEFGHLLLVDGSVEFTSTPRLRTVVGQGDDNGSIHILKPRL